MDQLLPLEREHALRVELHAFHLVLAMAQSHDHLLAVIARRRAWVIASILGAIGVIGAGFNGGSFLNYGLDFSSMLMALGFAAAIGSYAVGLYITC